MTTTALTVAPAVAELADVLRELNGVVERRNVQGFALMFAPQQIELPAGHVFVQRVDAETGVVTLVPTLIDECALTDVVQGTQEFDLRDATYIQFAGQPGRTHGCTVGRDSSPVNSGAPGRAHTHSPR